MKEQNQYDQIPSGILDRLQRILPLADKVVDEIVCEETEILEKIIPRMFEVTEKVAKISCDYVKRGRFCRQSSFIDLAMLTSVARTVGGPVNSETLGDMDKELARVIEDFDRAVNVEALRLVKETGTHSLSQSDNSRSSVVSCRARAFDWTAQVCGSWLFLEQPLYGWHPAIYPRSNHGLGD